MDIALEPTEFTDLPNRERPETADQAILHGSSPEEGELLIFAHQEALKIVDGHGKSDLRNEVGGFLLGHSYIDDGQPCIEIVAALPALTRDHGPVHFTLTADSWSMAHKEREAHYPDLQIVGWFHTHPDLGVFFSADDEIVQQTAFTLPWQVGLVVDPLRDEANFFGWEVERGVIGPISGFYELRQESEMSVVTWRAAYDTGLAGWWHRMASDAASEFDGYVPTAVASERDMFDLALRRGLYAGLIATLVSGLIATLFFIPLIRRNNDLERVLVGLLANEQAALYAAQGLSCPANDLFLSEPVIGQSFRVGETVQFWGVADQPDAVRYQLEARRLGDAADQPATIWQVIETRRWDQSLGSVGRWSTVDLPTGRYEIRLVALSRGGQPDLENACHTSIEIIPGETAQSPTDPIPSLVSPVEQPEPLRRTDE